MENVNTLILLPCFNVIQFCEEVIKSIVSSSYGLVLVDDGSTDGTEKLLKKYADENENVHLVRLEENRGKGHALLAGMKYMLENLEFDALVTMDADGQHTIGMAEMLQDKLNEGADFVVGGRQFSLMPWKSRIANTFMSFMLRLIMKGAPHDTQSGLRGHSKKFVKLITEKIKGGRYEMEFSCILLALDNKIEIIEVSVPTIYLEKNKFSHFHVAKDSYLVVWLLIKHFIALGRRRVKK